MLSCFSHVWFCVTLWTVAHQAPLSMEFTRQEYWSRLPFPSSGDLPDPESKRLSLKSPALVGGFFTTNAIWKVLLNAATAAAKSLQSCDPIDRSPQGSPIPGVLQARTQEWVAISFSNAWKWKVKVKSLSRLWLLAIPWTAAYQAPLSMGLCKQEYWSGAPLPSPPIKCRLCQNKPSKESVCRRNRF